MQANQNQVVPMETLEGRRMMSVSVANDGGLVDVLEIRGGTQNDTIVVTMKENGAGTSDDVFRVNVKNATSNRYFDVPRMRLVGNGEVRQIHRINAIGYGGDDIVVNSTRLPLRAFSGSHQSAGVIGFKPSTGQMLAHGYNGANTKTTFRTAGNDNSVLLTEFVKNGQKLTFSMHKSYGASSFGFYGGDHTDEVTNNSNLPMEAHTAGGQDVIFGGGSADRVLAGDGDDAIWTRGGNDDVYGGRGDDWIIGGDGFDKLRGEAGKDFIDGEGSIDWIWGGSDDDWCEGGAGDDWISGESGNDTLFGEAGYDQLLGGYGNDKLDGGIDGIKDLLHGGSGADKFRGEAKVQNGSVVNFDEPRDLLTGEGDTLF